MHLDMAPYIQPSEAAAAPATAAAAAAAVCTQVGGKRIRLYIELLQGGGGKDLLLIEIVKSKNNLDLARATHG